MRRNIVLYPVRDVAHFLRRLCGEKRGRAQRPAPRVLGGPGVLRVAQASGRRQPADPARGSTDGSPPVNGLTPVARPLADAGRSPFVARRAAQLGLGVDRRAARQCGPSCRWRDPDAWTASRPPGASWRCATSCCPAPYPRTDVLGSARSSLGSPATAWSRRWRTGGVISRAGRLRSGDRSREIYRAAPHRAPACSIAVIAPAVTAPDDFFTAQVRCTSSQHRAIAPSRQSSAPGCPHGRAASSDRHR
jgi:hypothetical protein